VLGEFLTWAGPEKIIYSDGSIVFHSQPVLERFRALERLDEFGIELTHEDKRLILGGNYARITGLDVEAAQAAIADDEFARERARTGRQEPYSNWRAERGAAEPAGAVA
jgi:hypothetical protein